MKIPALLTGLLLATPAVADIVIIPNHFVPSKQRDELIEQLGRQREQQPPPSHYHCEQYRQNGVLHKDCTWD